MAHSILVPIDGSERSLNALDFVFDYFTDATVTVIHVVNPVQPIYADAMGSPSQYDAEVQPREDAKDILDRAQERAALRSVDSSSRFESVIETGPPARTIVEYTVEHNIDHIVMGSRGRTGITRILLGSVAESVARRSPVPVTIVR